MFKIVMIGASEAGKTSIMLRYGDDMYNDAYISTIGVDFVSVAVSSWL